MREGATFVCAICGAAMPDIACQEIEGHPICPLCAALNEPDEHPPSARAKSIGTGKTERSGDGAAKAPLVSGS